MDDFQGRAIDSLRNRHESVITENAERVRDHIGYVLKRIEVGRAETVGLYAEDIAASVRRILAAVAALGAIEEVTGIMATSDEPR
jgi:hypothetical protein